MDLAAARRQIGKLAGRQRVVRVEPGRTVAASLRDFRRQLRGRKTKVIPWLQDFSLGRTYTATDVRQQIAAARRAHAAGYLLWNAAGLYTDGVLNDS